jgi:hypothetical protein
MMQQTQKQKQKQKKKKKKRRIHTVPMPLEEAIQTWCVSGLSRQISSVGPQYSAVDVQGPTS